MPPIHFRWARLQDLSAGELHALLAAREAVFVVEQNCPYQDADALDEHAWHLIGTVDNALAAYLRVVDPGCKSVHPGAFYAEPSIGRVLTVKAYRGLGLGMALMQEGITGCERLFPDQGIRISAQSYLLRFYHALGFTAVSEEYLEDDIPHFEMLRKQKPFHSADLP
jgi:ElaA protein